MSEERSRKATTMSSIIVYARQEVRKAERERLSLCRGQTCLSSSTQTEGQHQVTSPAKGSSFLGISTTLLRLTVLKMGTDEKDSESAAAAAQQAGKETSLSQPEQESAGEAPAGPTSETNHPLTTYSWHTGSKGTLDEVREGEGTVAAAPSPSSTLEKIQKASSNKWTKMQNWRKALSEENGEKSASGGKSGDGAKPEKCGTRRNPFKRAHSEPAGSLFSALTPSSGSTSSSSAAAAAAAATGQETSPDSSQKAGGGALIKKYLRTVSQKLKRPKQNRNSAPALPGNATYSLRELFSNRKTY